MSGLGKDYDLLGVPVREKGTSNMDMLLYSVGHVIIFCGEAKVDEQKFLLNIISENQPEVLKLGTFCQI